MQKGAFLIFFSIVLTVHLLVNFYIFIRGWQGLEAVKHYRIWYAVIFWLFGLSYVVGRVAGNTEETWFSKTLTIMGSYWFAMMLYFFLVVLIFDFARIANSVFHFFPEPGSVTYLKTKLLATLSISGVVLLVVIAGAINARIIRVTDLNLDIPKNGSKYKELNAVVVSDIHLGTLIRESHLQKIVHKINRLEPDIVLIPGDLTDEKIKPVRNRNLGPVLQQIRAKLGVYAITGNHEYIGGAEDAVRYFSRYGIKFIRDTSMLIDSSFYLVGREDRESTRFGGVKRQELEDVLTGIDDNKPIIMLDHQPWHLSEVGKTVVDVQFSGHTHHAQMWPLNYITTLMVGLSWGYQRIGNTHFYVTCGAGSWGPPVRTNSYPEIVHVKMHFTGDN